MRLFFFRKINMKISYSYILHHAISMLLFDWILYRERNLIYKYFFWLIIIYPGNQVSLIVNDYKLNWYIIDRSQAILNVLDRIISNERVKVNNIVNEQCFTLNSFVCEMHLIRGSFIHICVYIYLRFLVSIWIFFSFVFLRL